MVWGTVGRSTLVVIGVVGTILAMPFIKGGKKLRRFQNSESNPNYFKGEVPVYTYKYTVDDTAVYSDYPNTYTSKGQRQTTGKQPSVVTGMDAINLMRDKGAENIRIKFEETVFYKYIPLSGDGKTPVHEGLNPTLLSGSEFNYVHNVQEMTLNQFIQYGFSYMVKRNNYQLVKESMLRDGKRGTIKESNCKLRMKIIVDLPEETNFYSYSIIPGDSSLYPATRLRTPLAYEQVWPEVGPNHTGKFEGELR